MFQSAICNINKRRLLEVYDTFRRCCRLPLRYVKQIESQMGISEVTVWQNKLRNNPTKNKLVFSYSYWWQCIVLYRINREKTVWVTRVPIRLERNELPPQVFCRLHICYKTSIGREGFRRLDRLFLSIQRKISLTNADGFSCVQDTIIESPWPPASNFGDGMECINRME